MIERRELGEGCAGVMPLPDSRDHWLTRPCREEFWRGTQEPDEPRPT